MKLLIANVGIFSLDPLWVHERYTKREGEILSRPGLARFDMSPTLYALLSGFVYMSMNTLHVPFGGTWAQVWV